MKQRSVPKKMCPACGIVPVQEPQEGDCRGRLGPAGRDEVPLKGVWPRVAGLYLRDGR